MGRGSSSESGAVGVKGSLRDLSKNILKRGWIKAKLFVGGGVLKVSPPLPPRKF